ncbi:hypothetical protein [Streptomyces mexicanus]|uniref:hypothetical protein n=1 Tax=Streptomyces mexicanus TaxID=178566 RepID=UPI00364B4840
MGPHSKVLAGLAQEPADVADRADAHRHAQPVRIGTPQRDQNTVVIELSRCADVPVTVVLAR